MNKYKLINLANQYRSQWNVSLTDPIDIISIFLHKVDNSTLVFLSLPDDINGACFKFDEEKIIFINANHSEIRQRFTIAHELYHIEFNEDNFNFNNVDETEEENADIFANYLLLPDFSLKIDEDNLEEILETEQYYKIPHEEFIKRIDSSISNLDKIDVESIAGQLGYDTRAYAPYTDENITMGHYVKLAHELYDKELISNGLKEEYLNGAFCYKLVFGEF